MSRKFKLSLAMASVVAASVMFAVCNEEQPKAESKTAESEVQNAPAVKSAKSVVVYYSQTGATKKLAQIFKSARNADEFELTLAKPYPSTYDSTRAGHCLDSRSARTAAIVLS